VSSEQLTKTTVAATSVAARAPRLRRVPEVKLAGSLEIPDKMIWKYGAWVGI
jgi:hypothetical protein